MMNVRLCYLDSPQTIAAPFSVENVRVMTEKTPPPNAVFVGDSVPQLRHRYNVLTYRHKDGDRRWRSILPQNAWVVKR